MAGPRLPALSVTLGLTDSHRPLCGVILACPEAGVDAVPGRILIRTCLLSTLLLHSFLSERLSGSPKVECECVFVILTVV